MSFGKGTVEILSDKTLQAFNIDCNKLRRGSHQRVFVRCTRCNEEFTREWRRQHQKHACPTHIVRADGKSLKWCNGCSSYLSYNCFSKNTARADGLNSYCKACVNETPSSKKKLQKLRTARINNIENWIKWTTTRKRSECKKSGIDFDVDFDFLLNLWQQQNGLCFYAKTAMLFGENDLRSASLERRDPTQGYIKTNVVWASKSMNWAKNNSSEDEFLEFLFQMGLDTLSYPVRLECKLLSKHAQYPKRSLSTDAGYDISSIEQIIISAGCVAQVSTGIALSSPPGFYYSIDGRSSLWMRGIVPFRGIIDATYTGPLIVVLMNTSNEDYQIEPGDRIAQCVINRITHCDITIVDEFSPCYNQRGEAGFGSSGK